MPELVKTTAFLLPFTIGMLVTAVILWYQRVRQPIKRLRTPFGLLLLNGIILTMVSAGMAVFVAKSILTGNEVVQNIKEEKKKGYAPTVGVAGQAGKEEPASGGAWDRLKHGEPEEEPAEEKSSSWSRRDDAKTKE